MSKYSSDISRRYAQYNKEKQQLVEILKLYLQAIKRKKKAQELAVVHELEPRPIFEKSITDYVLYLQQQSNKFKHRNREFALSKDELKTLLDKCVDAIIREGREVL